MILPSPHARGSSKQNCTAAANCNLRRSWDAARLAMPADALGQLRRQRRYLESHLLGRIAVAQRYRVVFHGLMIDRNAERRTHLVLATIAPPDRASLIVSGGELPLEQPQHFLRLLGLPGLAQQRIDGDLDRGEPWIEAEYD